MAAIADELTTSPYVHSPLNLNAFSKWCRTATEEELEDVMNTVVMVEHRTPPELFGIPGPPPIIINRPDLGKQWPLFQVTCNESNCLRCTSGRGGWQFRWIGPWTCPNTVGDENTDPRDIVARALECRCGRHH